MSRRRASLLAGVLVASVAAGCSSRLGLPHEATRHGHAVLDLWRVLFWCAAGVLALVIAPLAYVLVRYRENRPGVGPVSERAGNVRLEVAYTALPLLLAGALFALSMRAGVGDGISSANRTDRPLTVDVTGFQWQWRFHYPDTGLTVVGAPGHEPELVLPLGRTVRLRLRAADVIHSFYVPAFLLKRDAIPGRPQILEVEPSRAGAFKGNCAEFCGLDHSRMGFRVRILEPAAFERWSQKGRGTGGDSG